MGLLLFSQPISVAYLHCNCQVETKDNFGRRIVGALVGQEKCFTSCMLMVELNFHSVAYQDIWKKADAREVWHLYETAAYVRSTCFVGGVSEIIGRLYTFCSKGCGMDVLKPGQGFN